MKGDIEVAVKELTSEIKKNASKRATKALTILRNSALEVLGQDGTGRTYIRGGKKKKPIIHVASAAGEPPAPDFGNLRKNWSQQKFVGGDLRIRVRIQSRMAYADFLEHGTRKMSPRPYHDRIKKKAIPEIKLLYSSI